MRTILLFEILGGKLFYEEIHQHQQPTNRHRKVSLIVFESWFEILLRGLSDKVPKKKYTLSNFIQKSSERMRRVIDVFMVETFVSHIFADNSYSNVTPKRQDLKEILASAVRPEIAIPTWSSTLKIFSWKLANSLLLFFKVARTWEGFEFVYKENESYSVGFVSCADTNTTLLDSFHSVVDLKRWEWREIGVRTWRSLPLGFQVTQSVS